MENALIGMTLVAMFLKMLHQMSCILIKKHLHCVVEKSKALVFSLYLEMSTILPIINLLF